VLTFGTQRVLAVERFDRQLHSSGQWWMRLPQEDFCQVLGLPSHLKYEADGGPGVRDISKVVRKLTTLPVTALPSHMHFDHTGGLSDFGNITLADLPAAKSPKTVEADRIVERQLAFGYTYEDLRMLLGPTASTGVQPISSMGNDTPLAVLSSKPKHLYSYFKQIFAQVTNPALDCIREELVTASETFIGSEGNLLAPGPKSCRMIRLDSPLIDNKALAQLREVNLDGFKATTIDAIFPASNRYRKSEN
jgi:hypothetical protein